MPGDYFLERKDVHYIKTYWDPVYFWNMLGVTSENYVYYPQIVVFVCHLFFRILIGSLDVLKDKVYGWRIVALKEGMCFFV